jgi:hypothetical protein
VRPPGPLDGGKTRCRADHLAAGLPTTAWQRRSAGDWTWLDQVTTDADPDDHGRHNLLIRTNTVTGELGFDTASP